MSDQERKDRETEPKIDSGKIESEVSEKANEEGRTELQHKAGRVAAKAIFRLKRTRIWRDTAQAYREGLGEEKKE